MLYDWKNISLCTKDKYHNDPKPRKYLLETALSFLQSQNDQFVFKVLAPWDLETPNY